MGGLLALLVGSIVRVFSHLFIGMPVRFLRNMDILNQLKMNKSPIM